jgi:membrane protease YdiL (CAAX protease family)
MRSGGAIVNISSGLRDSPSGALPNGAMNSDPECEPSESPGRIEPVEPTGPVESVQTIGPQSHAPLRDGRRNIFESVFLRGDSPQVEVRAGWRAGLYVALFILIFSILNIAGLFFQRRVAPGASPVAGGTMTPGFLFRQELAMAASAILAALLMSLLERRPFGDYGMPLRDAFRRPFWQGTLWGFAQISAVMLLIRAFGGYSFGGLAIHGQEFLRYGILWGALFVVVGVTEEFLFRGYLQFTLTSAMGFWPTATLLSVGFGAVHLANPGEGPVGAASVFAIGMLFCLTLRRTGNLWFAIGMHAAFDFGETFVYGVPDSGLVATGQMLASSLHGPRWLTGGSIGPEGSVLAFVVIGIVFVLFDRVYPRAQYVVGPAGNARYAAEGSDTVSPHPPANSAT